MAAKLKLTDAIFDDLTVLSVARSVPKRGVIWLCQCVCGNVVEVLAANLANHHTRSCGCRRSWVTAKEKTTHGLHKHPYYKTWANMRQRCLNPRDKKWPRYGGRGITVCAAWDNFAQFVSDMGPRPVGTTLDRKENNGPYDPANCRWALPVVQGNNTSRTVYLTYAGKTQSLSDWARSLGMSRDKLYQRYRAGWSLERMLA